MGSYTDSQGMSVVREHLAEYIMKRDEGIPCDPDNIFITDGASPIIKVRRFTKLFVMVHALLHAPLSLFFE